MLIYQIGKPYFVFDTFLKSIVCVKLKNIQKAPNGEVLYCFVPDLDNQKEKVSWELAYVNKNNLEEEVFETREMVEAFLKEVV